MPTDRGENEPRRSPGAHPPWLVLLLVIPVAVWLLVSVLPGVDVESALIRRTCRDFGYAVLLALLTPYLYVWRRLSLHRHGRRLSVWMHWHIGTAYLAFGLMVVHARGHLFRAELTGGIVLLFAAVMLSGMLGLVIQKTVFRLLALTLEEELGLRLLHVERQRLIEESDRLVTNYSMLTESDIQDWRGFCALLLDRTSKVNAKIWNHKAFPQIPRTIVQSAVASREEPEPKDELIAAMNHLLRTVEFCKAKDFEGMDLPAEAAELVRRPPKGLTELEIERRNRLYLELACPAHVARSRKPPGTVERFFEEAVAIYLRSEFPSWGWLFRGSALEPVPHNHYLRVRALVAPEHHGPIDQLWEWVQRRRRMDLEFWLHRLARAWLLVHGPASWALLVLVIVHVVSSLYYGGFL
jgi:hypothetical protein